MESFKKTMPLIMDLRNPAMRPRHWASLMESVRTTFDPTGPDFTLDSVVKLHLDQHAELIADLSGNASKELAIELSIQVLKAAQSTHDQFGISSGSQLHLPTDTRSAECCAVLCCAVLCK